MIICEEKENDAGRPYLTLSAVREGLQPASRACASEAPRASLCADFVVRLAQSPQPSRDSRIFFRNFFCRELRNAAFQALRAARDGDVLEHRICLDAYPGFHSVTFARPRGGPRTGAELAPRAAGVGTACAQQGALYVGRRTARATRLVREENLSCLWCFRRALPMWGGKR